MAPLTYLILLVNSLVVSPATIDSDPRSGATDSVAASAAAVRDSARHVALPEPSCRISIASLTVSDMNLLDTLDILIEAENLELAGCDLKVAVESGLVDILEVLPGDIVDSCRWDIFSARQLKSPDPSVGPAEIWKIVVLAQEVADTAAPICYGFERPASLARLVVSSAHVAVIPDTTIGIFFYWESCGDNVVSGRDGSSLMISKSVDDVLPIRHQFRHAGFPTRLGAPDECISPRAKYPPKRIIAFRNGGVVFKAALQPAPDSAGSH